MAEPSPLLSAEMGPCNAFAMDLLKTGSMDTVPLLSATWSCFTVNGLFQDPFRDLKSRLVRQNHCNRLESHILTAWISMLTGCPSASHSRVSMCGRTLDQGQMRAACAHHRAGRASKAVVVGIPCQPVHRTLGATGDSAGSRAHRGRQGLQNALHCTALSCS